MQSLDAGRDQITDRLHLALAQRRPGVQGERDGRRHRVLFVCEQARFRHDQVHTRVAHIVDLVEGLLQLPLQRPAEINLL